MCNVPTSGFRGVRIVRNERLGDPRRGVSGSTRRERQTERQNTLDPATPSRTGAHKTRSRGRRGAATSNAGPRLDRGAKEKRPGIAGPFLFGSPVCTLFITSLSASAPRPGSFRTRTHVLLFRAPLRPHVAPRAVSTPRVVELGSSLPYPPGVKLPGVNRAVVDPAKLRDYLLSPSHPVGRFKARFFFRLGFDRETWHVLEVELRRHAGAGVVAEGETSPYGRKFEVRGKLSGPTGRGAQVVAIWIFLAGEDFPRFVTAFPG